MPATTSANACAPDAHPLPPAPSCSLLVRTGLKPTRRRSETSTVGKIRPEVSERPAGVVTEDQEIIDLRCEVELLREIVRVQELVTSAERQPGAVMQVVAESARRLTGATSSSIELLDGDEMVLAAVAGTSGASVGDRLPADRTLAGLSARTKRILRCDDTRTDHRLGSRPEIRVEPSNGIDEDDGPRSMIVAPLLDAATCQGVLAVSASEPDFFTERDEDTLRTMAGFFARAVRNALEFTASADAAATDALTGLPNRGFVLEHLARTLAREHGSGVTVLFVDLDRFKKVNDDYGHKMGDRVLVAAARRLRASLRSDDVLGRLGGDEFVVIAQELPDTAASAMAGRLRQELCEPFYFDDLQLGIGASVGISHARPGDDAEELLARADAEMYRSKPARAATPPPASLRWWARR
jgi:diguanylate cyclase (GGDEF)-like protein